MHWSLRIPLSVVLIALLGCASSSPTRPTDVAPSDFAARVADSPWSYVKGGPSAAARGVEALAVIGGFRVHPDPGDDGVIRVVDGDKVVVNATDIAPRPPAPPSYLVVNWGDGPNQRVGCGPCRMDHAYAPGRYTLVASADGLPAERSISITVEVSAAREERTSHVEFFGFSPSDVAVGGTGVILLPTVAPPGVSLTNIFGECVPDEDILQPNGTASTFPTYVALPFITTGPGTCTLFLVGEDASGPFTDTSTLTIH